MMGNSMPNRVHKGVCSMMLLPEKRCRECDDVLRHTSAAKDWRPERLGVCHGILLDGTWRSYHSTRHGVLGRKRRVSGNDFNRIHSTDSGAGNGSALQHGLRVGLAQL